MLGELPGMKGREENDEFLDGKHSSGRPFEVDEVPGNASDSVPEYEEESSRNHLGFIDRWNPIPSLRRLIDRLFPPRRSMEP